MFSFDAFVGCLCSKEVSSFQIDFYTRYTCFLSSDGKTDAQPFSYIPFGCGTRMCIGNKFALMEMRVVLATLVKKFSFREVPGCVVKEVNRGITHPDGLKLRIYLVEGSLEAQFL